jgi:hypothetical protein
VLWRWETLRPEDGGDDWTNSMVRDPTETWDVRVLVCCRCYCNASVRLIDVAIHVAWL